MIKKIVNVVALVVTAIAVISVSSASVLFFNQPKEPKCLRK